MRDLRHCATRNALALSFLAAIFLFPACGTRVSTLYEKVLGSPTYGRTTETYTRTKEVHDGLDTRFIFSATWLSHEWIRAFSEEYANIYYLDAERKEKVISLWKGESGTYVRFFPYSGTWYRAYEVAFPMEALEGPSPKPGAPRLKLVLSGVQGRAVLSWE